MKTVAAELHNTPAVCRSSYVHPAVVESYTAGGLSKLWATTPARGSSLMSADERRLLRVLEALTR
jgi:DNA topoisomerase I